MEFTDRYDALGILPPDPKTMCKGQCEGTGWIPVYMSKGEHNDSPDRLHKDDETDPVLIALWEVAEKANPADDGYHFVKCPDCNGTGLEKAIKEVEA